MFDLYSNFEEFNRDDIFILSEHDRKIGQAQERRDVRDIVMNRCNSLDKMLQIGNGVFVTPVDYNGNIHYVKVTFEYFPTTNHDIELTNERWLHAKNK